MAKEKWGLTDEEVEAEIARLNASEAVALARRELRLKYRRRQRLYQLRDLEKKGKALMAAGITREILDAMYSDDEEAIEINFEKQNNIPFKRRYVMKPKITMYIGDKQVDHFPEDYAKKLADVIGETLSTYYSLHPERFDEVSARLNKR